MPLSKGWEAFLIALIISVAFLLVFFYGPIVYRKIKEAKKQWRSMWGAHF